MDGIRPIDPDFAREFAAQITREGYKHIEEKTLTVSRAWATTDIASSASQHASFEVFNNTSGNLVERTQNPPITSGNSLPKEMRIALFAVQCVVRLGNLGTIAQALSIQPDLDRTKLTFRQGGVEHFELAGSEFMDYGPALMLGNDTTAGNTGRAPQAPRTMRIFAMPRIIGAEQTMSLQHHVARSAAWPVAFTADYNFPALIARRVV